MRETTSKPEIAEVAEGRAPAVRSALADNQITDRIIGAAIEVHRHLGPGLLESAYDECLCYELSKMDLKFQRQVHLPIEYKGLRLDCCYKMDIVVEDRIVVEIKAIDQLLPIHTAQLLTYLKASHNQLGLLINFNETVLKKGLKRIVNRYTGQAPAPRISASSALDPDRGHSSTRPPETLLYSPRPSPRLRVSAVNRSSH